MTNRAKHKAMWMASDSDLPFEMWHLEQLAREAASESAAKLAVRLCVAALVVVAAFALWKLSTVWASAMGGL